MNIDSNGTHQTLPELPPECRVADRPCIKLKIKPPPAPRPPVAKKADWFDLIAVYIWYFIIFTLAASIGFAFYLLWEKISL
jgi:hypothetical protein